jgi:hypothetical protein
MQELNVSEDLARRAMNEAEGVLERARDILLELLPKYLFIKAKYLSHKTDGSGGLFFICLEKGSTEYIIVKALVYSDREWLREVTVHRLPEMFYQQFSDFIRDHRTSSHIYDSQKSKDDFVAAIHPADFAFMFNAWDRPKEDASPESPLPADPSHPAAKLRSIFESYLSNKMLQRIEAEVDYDFYTRTQFDAIREAVDLERAPREKPSIEEAQKEAPEERFKIYFKGQFVIDPISGKPLEQVQVGDLIYCDLLDRNEMALAAARLIGAFKHGMWVPVRGVVVEIQDMMGERRKYRLKLAPGTYADVLSFVGFKVRTTPLTVQETVTKAREFSISPAFSPFLPLVIAVALVVVLVIALLMMR